MRGRASSIKSESYPGLTRGPSSSTRSTAGSSGLRYATPEDASKKILIGAVALLAALTPTMASAHLVAGEAIGFVSGFLHPISGWDHIIAMVAVGIWGAQLGRPAIWTLPVTFPLVMAVGGFLGLIGLKLPGAEIAIALSGLCLGAAVAFEWRAPLPAAAVLVGLFGLFHGYAHGSELPPGQNALLYSLGFIMATGLLHATGIAIGLIHRWLWGRRALRLAGVLIGCGGAFFLWKAAA